MAITVTNATTERIMRLILNNEPYQKVTLELISDQFLEFAVQFFRDIVLAKYDGNAIDSSWYKQYFLAGRFPSNDTNAFAGLNTKTVTNMYGSGSRQVVLNVTPKYHDELLAKIEQLVDSEFRHDIEIDLAITYNNVTIHLTLSETLVVVNALAAKRSQIRGGAWSSVGKQIELPFMVTLAKLFSVPRGNYDLKGLTAEDREVDFHFLDRLRNPYFCEVKLMGKGNPESADSTVARDSDILIAHTISDTMKKQLTQNGCHWVELTALEGYRKIFHVLEHFDVPCIDFTGDLDSMLDQIIPQVFEEVG